MYKERLSSGILVPSHFRNEEREGQEKLEIDMFNGPDLIFVLGPSGAGKTTFIHEQFGPNIFRNVEFMTDFTYVYKYHGISHERGKINHYHPNSPPINGKLQEHSHDIEKKLKELGDVESNGNFSTYERYMEYEAKKREILLLTRDLPVTYTDPEIVDELYQAFFEDISKLKYTGHPTVIEWAGGVNMLTQEHPAHEVQYSYEHMLPFFMKYLDIILPRVKGVFHIDTPLDKRNQLNERRGASRGSTLPSVFGKDDAQKIMDVFQQNIVFDIKNTGVRSDLDRLDILGLVVDVCLVFIAQQNAIKALERNYDIAAYQREFSMRARRQLLDRSYKQSQESYQGYLSAIAA